MRSGEVGGEWLALPASDHEVPISNPAGGVNSAFDCTD